MGDGSIRDPYRPGDTRKPGPDLQLQMIALASSEALGEAVLRANRLRDDEFNRRVAAELREVELGRQLEESKAEVRELRKTQARLNDNIAKANGETIAAKKHAASLEAALKAATRRPA